MVTELRTPEDYTKVVDKYDAFLFDCDGVIWSGDEVIAGVKDALSLLRKHNKKVLFVTNNATQSRRTFKEKFDKLGIEVKVEEIFGSSYATVAYMKTQLKVPTSTKVYVIGEAGLEEELRSEGYKYAGGTDPEDLSNGKPLTNVDEITADSNVGVVVAGLDRLFSYKKLAKAQRYLKENEGCIYLATNDDKTYPTKSLMLPGAGFVSAALSTVSGKTPTVCGKPNKPMMDAILATDHLDPKRTIMIGDRLDTDILFGYNSGIDTLHVLTGVHQESDYKLIEGKGPTYNAKSFGDFSKAQ